MSVKIKSVESGSRAQRIGIQAGDILLSINGHTITDVLDYRFFETERELRLRLLRNGEEYERELKKPQYAELGLGFETYLMDKQRSCKNKCIFCFIDQLPPGMRKTLYFKDDDDRLSFLFGNYITLTNIDDREIERILQMRISPINVSVHTMDPHLRCQMMNNRFAGESLQYLYQLAEGGIKLNCQIVLCPGINDGKALEYTLEKLFELGEGLLSVACVPVGLTKYRDGLFPLTPYNQITAAKTLEIIERFGEQFRQQRGSRTVYPSDEFYLLADKPLPEAEFYEDFPQIENGVGLLVNLQEEFREALDGLIPPESPRMVTLVTGVAAFPVLDSMLDELRRKCHNLTIQIIPVVNDFFGGTVDVTGLVTGGDILKTVKGKELGEVLLIPSTMLKAREDIFLDDITLEQLSTQLDIPVLRVENTGEALLAALLGLPIPDAGGWDYYEGAGELPG